MPQASDEQMQAYRATCRRRDEAERRRQREARRAGLAAARRAAALLRRQFGAERVRLFGSLAREEDLGPHSDIDLAVVGLSPADYYRAVAQVQRVAGARTVDLVRYEQCGPSLRTRIDTEGRSL